MKKTFKSIGAVFAGFASVVVLSILTDAILETTGVFPPVKDQRDAGAFTSWMALIALGYRMIYSVAGSYLAAGLAPDRPMRHAMILGIVGFAVSLVGTIVMWGTPPDWYPMSLVVVAIPCAWIGGKLKVR